jgi:hypothetical protein
MCEKEFKAILLEGITSILQLAEGVFCISQNVVRETVGRITSLM